MHWEIISPELVSPVSEPQRLTAPNLPRIKLVLTFLCPNSQKTILTITYAKGINNQKVVGSFWLSNLYRWVMFCHATYFSLGEIQLLNTRKGLPFVVMR